MSIIISTQEEVQEYFDSPRLGQSKLKKLLDDLSFIDKEVDSTQEHFLIGSGVDCILTAGGEAVYNSKYYVSTIESKPSDTMVQILNLVHNKVLEDYAEYLNSRTELEPTTNWDQVEDESSLDNLLSDVEPGGFADFAGDLINWETYILDAVNQTGWQPKWGTEAKLKNVLIEPNLSYFKDLAASFGKTILSATQDKTIKNIVLSLRTHPRTKRFFDLADLAQASAVDFYYQFPIYFDYREVECKALLDMVVVVREASGKITSVTGIDLKTMSGNTFHFMSALKRRRYDIQAAWYDQGLKDHFALGENNPVLRPFMFVVESSTFQGKPLVFSMSDSLLNIGRYGKRAITLLDTNLFDRCSTNTILQREVLGFEQLLDLHKYHTEFGFDEEREIKEAGNKPLILEWDGILSSDS